MKINSKILSIPPYISSSWDNIVSLYVEQKQNAPVLIVLLYGGSRLEIPHLTKEEIEQVFKAHEQFLEESSNTGAASADPLAQMNLGIPLSFSPENMQAFFATMQNPDHLQNLQLPKEAVMRIAEIAKALGLDESNFELPTNEPHQNNPLFEQIRKALRGESLEDKEQTKEETVSDEELQFKEWDIEKIDDKLYKVTHPLDKEEHYQVFIGHPIGCTCGKKGCDHLKAVLRSNL